MVAMPGMFFLPLVLLLGTVAACAQDNAMQAVKGDGEERRSIV
jgi:hypothetical protein